MALPSSPTPGLVATDSSTGRLYFWDATLSTWSFYGGVCSASVTSAARPGVPTSPKAGELLYDTDTNQLQINNPTGGFRLINSGGQDTWRQSAVNPPAIQNYLIPFDTAPAVTNIPLLDNTTNPGQFTNNATYTRKFHCVLTVGVSVSSGSITEYRAFFTRGAAPNGQNAESMHVQYDAQQENGFTIFSTQGILEVPAGGDFRAYVFGGTGGYLLGGAVFGIDAGYSTKLVITELG